MKKLDSAYHISRGMRLLPVIALHALFDAELEVAFHKGRHLGDGLFENGAVFGRELREHPVTQVEFRGALAHAEADARELVAHVLDDVPKPVLAAVTAVLAAADAAHVQVDIVAEDEQMVGLHLVPGHQGLHGFAREVHVRLRLGKQAFLPRDVHLHGERLVFAFPVLVRVGQLFDSHEARVVVGVGILSTRISETDDDVHRGSRKLDVGGNIEKDERRKTKDERRERRVVRGAGSRVRGTRFELRGTGSRVRKKKEPACTGQTGSIPIA